MRHTSLILTILAFLLLYTACRQPSNLKSSDLQLHLDSLQTLANHLDTLQQLAQVNQEALDYSIEPRIPEGITLPAGTAIKGPLEDLPKETRVTIKSRLGELSDLWAKHEKQGEELLQEITLTIGKLTEIQTIISKKEQPDPTQVKDVEKMGSLVGTYKERYKRLETIYITTQKQTSEMLSSQKELVPGATFLLSKTPRFQ